MTYAPTTTRTPSRSAIDHLNPAENDLLTLLGQGLRATAIAHQLELPLPLVRARIDDLLATLGIDTQIEALILHLDHHRRTHGSN